MVLLVKGFRICQVDKLSVRHEFEHVQFDKMHDIHILTDIRVRLRINAGILNTAPSCRQFLSIRKPLSARRQSPWTTLSRDPESRVIFLPETLPHQPDDKM